YLRQERDLRGFDGSLGWIHATAHTADLLQALSRNPMLTHEEQARIYDGINQRLRSAPEVFSQGEQARLAQVVSAWIARTDADQQLSNGWLDTIEKEDKDVWKVKPLTPERLAVYQNHTYLLQSLVVRLSIIGPSDFGARALALVRPR